MKRMLAAMLSALLLVTFLPLASPLARAGAAIPEVTFDVVCSVDFAYTGETVEWKIINLNGASNNLLFALDVFKDDQPLSDQAYNSSSARYYMFRSPGKYCVQGWVMDLDKGKEYPGLSQEITVTESPGRVISVEPLGATSLRITWNKVPGATKYRLYRSTDMVNWDLVREVSGTSFANTYLKPGTRYYYSVKHSRPGVYGGWLSNYVAGVPMAKTRITSLTSPSGRRIRMTWAKAAGASGYQVAMATSRNGSYKSVRIVTGGTTAIFSGVKSGTTLFFKVRPYRRIYTTTYWGQYSAPRAVKVK
ncbi:MAG: fibronectin type III domain-containing protein [Bacillota bacterium]|nr:fibronectin type III domain-containing protein [Bacillota bacterium]